MAYRETEHEAFVVSKLEHEYFAYCKDVPKDLIIDANLSPKGVDILGKWVRVSVHRGNVVCRPVRIIDNLYESRIWNATPQIKVKIEYDGIHGNNLKMFFNDYLGFVSDPHEVMANFDRCSLHQVWIERYKANGTNSRWGISKTQDNHSHET
ncbi:hypothetical protein CAEBREN_17225 [Caenorhabditis brenneri]|uniref:Uncharacterized protein n=1 Tax=Caenorhabditis brenneri TaxID=135651 RepID=G0NYI1_CAEBE|nr:hypothetical protein CAEBREN_17225 [Caenorhabditis brenneri]